MRWHQSRRPYPILGRYRSDSAAKRIAKGADPSVVSRRVAYPVVAGLLFSLWLFYTLPGLRLTSPRRIHCEMTQG